MATIEDYLTPEKNDDGSFVIGSKANMILAMKIEKAMPNIKGDLLFSFFNEISNILPNSTVIADNHAYDHVGGLVNKKFSEKTCKDWFIDGRRNRKHVGVLYDIENSDLLLCVIAATKEIHIGVTSKPSVSGDIDDDDVKSKIKKLGLGEKKWGLPRSWYSKCFLLGAFDFNEKTISFFLNEGSEERKDANKLVTDIYSTFKT